MLYARLGIAPRAERAATAKLWPIFRSGRTFEERRLSAVGDTVDRMAYDTELADRIRELVASELGVEEKRMFGGLAFLVNGNMSVAASSKGGLMVRVRPEDADKLLHNRHVTPMVMAGRETRGWLRVSADGVKTKRQLQAWVSRGVDCAKRLPPK